MRATTTRPLLTARVMMPHPNPLSSKSRKRPQDTDVVDESGRFYFDDFVSCFAPPGLLGAASGTITVTANRSWT